MYKTYEVTKHDSNIGWAWGCCYLRATQKDVDIFTKVLGLVDEALPNYDFWTVSSVMYPKAAQEADLVSCYIAKTNGIRFVDVVLTITYEEAVIFDKMIDMILDRIPCPRFGVISVELVEEGPFVDFCS